MVGWFYLALNVVRAGGGAAAVVAPRTYPLGIGRGLNRRIQVIG
jgi:hypothetical protein